MYLSLGILCVQWVAIAELMNECVPSPRLDLGAACVYGTQCDSDFCCPNLRICMVDSSTGISTAIMKERNTPAHYEIIRYGACAPTEISLTCAQLEDGTAVDGEYDPTQCNCNEEYVAMYMNETWVDESQCKYEVGMMGFCIFILLLLLLIAMCCFYFRHKKARVHNEEAVLKY